VPAPAPALRRPSVPAPAPVPQLWGDASQEPSATASVTQGELEQIRRQLQGEPSPRRTAAASTPEQPEDTDRSLYSARAAAATVAAPRGVLKPSLGIAALTIFASAIAAHQTGNLPRIDLPQVPSVNLDLRPVLTPLGKAQTALRERYDEYFGGAQPPLPVPMLPRAAPQPPAPVVEQLKDEVPSDSANQTLLSEIPEEVLESRSMESPALEDEDPGRRAHAQRPVRGKGVLRLNSQPWSEIYVDDKPMGHTPEMHLELPAGRHNIRLKNSDHNLVKTFTEP